MFTPRRLAIGDEVTTTCDLQNAEGTFGTGHRFEIIDIHYHGDRVLYDLRDHDLHLFGAPAEP